ncbi:MAG: type II secretion system protein [Armatimonadetes bacterium]|nr:type II secretion system protein [Armatimonadota bacterium]
MDCPRVRLSRRSAGFTLIELLVVIAITSILVTLLMAPLIQGFTITKRTQLTVLAQESARQTLESVTREIQSAVYVYDNSGQALNLPVVDRDGNPTVVSVPYAMVDLVPPKLMMHCDAASHPANKPRDYPRGDLAWPVCPYTHTDGKGNDQVEARPITPVEPDSTIVRYFIGLRDPSQPYSGGGSGSLLAGDQANGYVLYRAEFHPDDPTLLRQGPGGFILHDPNFFYDRAAAPNGETFSANWKRVSKVVGPVTDVDLVTIDFNTAGQPIVNPVVRFVPRAVRNDVLTPTEIGRAAEGEPNAPPTTYRASSGLWSPGYQVRLYRNIGQPGQAVYYTAQDTNGDVVIIDAATGDAVFDITQYQRDGTLTDDKPKMMFLVDPNKGEVTFDIPAEPLTLTPDRIARINADFHAAYGLEGAALRTVRLTPFGLNLANSTVKIIPGSVRVFGPDWTPGPNYGHQVQYTRVSSLAEDPKGNQFSINFEDGEIRFDSTPTRNMPENGDGLQVLYSVQTNQRFDTAQGDMLSADYVTKNVLRVEVAYRIFDDRNRPQQMSLANNVLVRNFHR